MPVFSVNMYKISGFSASHAAFHASPDNQQPVLRLRKAIDLIRFGDAVERETAGTAFVQQRDIIHLRVARTAWPRLRAIENADLALMNQEIPDMRISMHPSGGMHLLERCRDLGGLLARAGRAFNIAVHAPRRHRHAEAEFFENENRLRHGQTGLMQPRHVA